MHVKLIAITQPLELHNCEELIEYAGRKCTATTDRTGENTARFIKARVKQGHTSILEHINFTFEIDGISRACLAQLTRHRIASYSVESLRYVTKDKVEFVLPDAIKNDRVLLWTFNQALDLCQSAYNIAIGRGVKPEIARMILPLATQTNLVMTINLRSLLNFFDLRLDKAAQAEIRELAGKMKAIVMEYCPNAF